MVNRLSRTPIAIIGMASIFPQAHNVCEYWDNIVRKVDSITDVPPSRWSVDDYYDPDPTAPDKAYSKRGGFLPDIDFDPMEFGLPPNILEVTDVSQLLALVVARDALIDSGYGEAAPTVRDRTGVVLGASGGLKLLSPLTSRLQYPVWRKALKSAGVADHDIEKIVEKIKAAYVRWEENSFPGLLPNVIAGRVANRLDLGGMNCTVDAACASSMSAMKLAVSDLVEGRADMMLTGGVDTDNSIFAYICFSKTPAFTKGDHPRPFDEASDGMMVGEGVGMIVLKRLEDAERDGDRVYAVLRGIGASSDGRFKSIYAPRGEGQEKALVRAYEDAELSPMDVSLIEAHGTGTVAGDQTETTTLVRFFNQHSSERGKVALGSVKSQIGHTKGAAGIAGVIKAALALYHKVLPPTINVDTPNAKLGLDDSPLYINTEARPWISSGAARRAGVSSFGFGGTNFHFVFEEHQPEQRGAYRMHRTAEMILLNAGSPDALLAQINQAISDLNGAAADQAFLNLARASRSLSVPASDARIGFVASDAAEARDLLGAAARLLTEKRDAEEWTHPKGIHYRRSALNVTGRVVALFSGQGAQYTDMGRELALNFPALRESFQQIDRLFRQDHLTTVSEVVYPVPAFTKEAKDAQAEMLQRTDYVQPAVGAFSAGLYRTLQAAGFRPDFVAGHSFGELTALWAAGALSDGDYYMLVKARGLAMAPPSNSDPGFDPGTMLAVTGDLTHLAGDVAALPGVHMANINSPRQIVLAGGRAVLESARAALSAKGYNVVPVAVSAAFHTPLVGHAQKPFAEAIQRATFQQPSIPVYSNASAQPYPTDPTAIRQTLSDHILQSVQFSQEIENLYAAGGTVFIEFGPRNILTNLVKDVLGDRPHLAIALNGSRQKDSDRQFREAVVQMRVIGLNLGDVDPYAYDDQPTAATASAEAPKKKGMSVKISGGPYVSEKTRQGWENALNDGYRIQGAGEPVIKEVIREVVKEVPVEVRVEVPVAAASGSSAPVSAPDLSAGLDQFSRVQAEVLRAHEQYLANQAEYIKVFSQLAAQQGTMLASGGLSPNSVDSLSRAMNAFHDHQAETLRVHEDYLRRQAEYTQSLLDAMRQHYTARGGNNAQVVGAAPAVNGGQPNGSAAVLPSAPVVPMPVPVAAPAPAAISAPAVAPAPVAPAPVAVATPPPKVAPGIDLGALSNAMLEIVSDKTGYPVEMLELSMDIEADLGIDSIKRVEILGAMRDRFPQLPQLKPEELAELRTLQQIVDYMNANAGGSAVSAPVSAPAPTAAPAPMVESAPVAPAPVAVAAPVPKVAPGIDLAALSSAMLEIVSDKTGYPVEMLELSMDIEADLGIDSIKRVEILGAMRDRYPELPQLKPEELAELRTLQQIVDYMNAHGGSSAPEPIAAPVATPATPEPIADPEAEAIARSGGQLASTVVTPGELNSVVDSSALAIAMLEIVSDKTGYPVEMLELSMDIEADLGIDSIKRVEILGAMRDRYPELPQLKPEELAELRTLQQIVDYMNAHGGSSAAVPAAPQPQSAPAPAPAAVTQAVPVAPVSAPGIDLAALSSAMLEIVSDKTGYPVEMLELSMDIEADLGIDSIKRVEILGAMRDRFPQLPQLKPEELAELRTLQQIVDYMAAHVNGPDTPDGGGAPSGGVPFNEGAVAAVVPPGAVVTTSGTNGHRAALPRLQHDIPRQAARLNFLPQPDTLDIDLPAGSVVVITDDGSGLTAEVAGRLASREWPVVILTLPPELIPAPAPLPVDVPRLTLPDLTETQLTTALEEIAGQYGRIAAFIHLNPALKAANGDLFAEREKAILKQVFLIAKHLKKPLNDSAERGFGAFVTVARLDGAFGTSKAMESSVISAGLFGLTKSVNLEWPRVFCRALDLAADLSATAGADHVLAELHDPNRLVVEVGYGAQGRVTLVTADQVPGAAA